MDPARPSSAASLKVVVNAEPEMVRCRCIQRCALRGLPRCPALQRRCRRHIPRPPRQKMRSDRIFRQALGLSNNPWRRRRCAPTVPHANCLALNEGPRLVDTQKFTADHTLAPTPGRQRRGIGKAGMCVQARKPRNSVSVRTEPVRRRRSRLRAASLRMAHALGAPSFLMVEVERVRFPGRRLALADISATCPQQSRPRRQQRRLDSRCSGWGASADESSERSARAQAAATMRQKAKLTKGSGMKHRNKRGAAQLAKEGEPTPAAMRS